MRYGKLIGASLGPGDPELITRRAWAALNSAARWAYPVKKAQADSYALSIVQRAGLAVPDDAVPMVFPMTYNARVLARAWAELTEQTLTLLAGGRDLVFLVEGDASTFSTFGHLARGVRAHAPHVEVDTIPGVSSFAAAAAASQIQLAEADETLGIIPAAYGVAVIDRMLDEFDTLVLMKIKPMLDEVIELLTRRQLLAHAVFVEKVGCVDQRIVHDLGQLHGSATHYLSLLVVKNPQRQGDKPQGGCRSKRNAALSDGDISAIARQAMTTAGA